MTKQSLDQLGMTILNIPANKTLSHFATTEEYFAYKLGHQAARHAAVELLLNFIAQNEQGE